MDPQHAPDTASKCNTFCCSPARLLTAADATASHLLPLSINTLQHQSVKSVRSHDITQPATRVPPKDCCHCSNEQPLS